MLSGYMNFESYVVMIFRKEKQITLQQLQYVLTIAQEGSITKAAHVLYKSQPNISNAIHELEEELQIQIFKRTPNGVLLTPEGEEFLIQADAIIEQVNSLKKKYSPDNSETFRFRISISRSSYIVRGISEWLNHTVDSGAPLDLHILETNTNRVIENVSSGHADLGIIRIPSEQSDSYKTLLKSKNISMQILMEFPLRIVFKKDHPLSRYQDIPYEKLEPYTEIIHGDDRVLAIQKSQINPGPDMKHKKRKIYVYDRGSQINLLENIKDSYMWVSPIPLDMLNDYDMVLKDCSFATIKNQDILIYRSSQNHALVKECREYLTKYVKEILKSIETREK